MSSADITTDLAEGRHAIPRQWIVTGGRVALAVALLLAWEWGARAFGPLFFAPPLATAQRIIEMAGNGKLFTDIAIMQLVERDELNLDAPITNYLPDFRPRNPFGTAIRSR